MPASESRMPASSSTMRMLCMFGDHGRWRRFRHHRKLHDKARADRMVLLHPNGAAVIFDDPTYDRKPQPGAALLGREIWKKKFFLEFARDAMTGIRNTDLHRIPAGHECRADFNFAHHGILCGLGGVIHEVSDCSPDRLMVRHYLWQ